MCQAIPFRCRTAGHFWRSADRPHHTAVVRAALSALNAFHNSKRRAIRQKRSQSFKSTRSLGQVSALGTRPLRVFMAQMAGVVQNATVRRIPGPQNAMGGCWATERMASLHWGGIDKRGAAVIFQKPVRCSAKDLCIAPDSGRRTRNGKLGNETNSTFGHFGTETEAHGRRP